MTVARSPPISYASSHAQSSSASGEWFYSQGRPDLSRELFEGVALVEGFVEFLTLPAYERLER